MNHRANTRLIGAFVSAALVVVVGLVVFFGSSSVFKKSTRFILFFDQSINGLSVGSPVKFRGVPIGSVDRIMIRFRGQPDDSTAIPVIIRIDQSRLEGDLGVAPEIFEADAFNRAIERGLAGQLNLESFITGQLFVELGFARDDESFFHVPLDVDPEMAQIPTITSSMDQITSDIAKLVRNLGAIDLERLDDNLNRSLENLSGMIAGIDSEGVSRSVRDAAETVNAFFGSSEFAELRDALRKTIEEAGETVASMNLESGPLAARVGDTMTQMNQVLEHLDALVTGASVAIGPGSDLRFELESTLRDLGRAARSLRELTDLLERNPRAFLTGRPEDEAQ